MTELNQQNREILGAVHSFQSLGAVDGPGIRYVIFMQGCPYRCPYCHNPDTRKFAPACHSPRPLSQNEVGYYTPQAIAENVMRYLPYFGKNGGVTVSGGEPLCQKEFIFALFKELKERGINTALDTASVLPDGLVEQILESTDTVLCDIKFPCDSLYREHLGISLDDVLEFLALCQRTGKDIVIRHVVVPGLTDTEQNVKDIISLALSVCKPRKIELLPFKKLCTEKYERLGIPFPLADTEECSDELISSLRELVPKELR